MKLNIHSEKGPPATTIALGSAATVGPAALPVLIAGATTAMIFGSRKQKQDDSGAKAAQMAAKVAGQAVDKGGQAVGKAVSAIPGVGKVIGTGISASAKVAGKGIELAGKVATNPSVRHVGNAAEKAVGSAYRSMDEAVSNAQAADGAAQGSPLTRTVAAPLHAAPVAVEVGKTLTRPGESVVMQWRGAMLRGSERVGDAIGRIPVVGKLLAAPLRALNWIGRRVLPAHQMQNINGLRAGNVPVVANESAGQSVRGLTQMLGKQRPEGATIPHVNANARSVTDLLGLENPAAHRAVQIGALVAAALSRKQEG